MGKYRIFVYLLLLLALNASCLRENRQEKISLDLLNEAEDSIEYSFFVESIESIRLELTGSCLIGEISDVAISQDRTFVFDKRQQTIWIFDRNGKYIDKISKQGDGPGEYLQITQFEYDAKNNQIIVLSPWKKALLFYTSEGEYLKTVNLEIVAEDFKVSPYGGFVLSNAGSDEPTAGIYYVNENGQEMECLVRRKNNHLVYITLKWELCSYDDIICFMAPNFDNTVYHFDNHGLAVSYPFVMKPELKHDYKETVSLQYFEDFIRTTYLEGEKWILASYWSSVNDLRFFLYSKDSGKYWIGKTLVNDLSTRGTGILLPVTGNGIFATWNENDNPDENPIINILHLK